MYVCLCNGVTDRQLINAAGELASGSRISAEQIVDQLGVGLGCGSCREFALALVERSAAREVAVLLPDGGAPGPISPGAPHHELMLSIGPMRDGAAPAHQGK